MAVRTAPLKIGFYSVCVMEKPPVSIYILA